eukprot:164651-Chlamydomonas_euryale.AAC.1
MPVLCTPCVLHAPWGAQVAEWYPARALLLDASSGQLAHAIALLEAAVARGVPGRAAPLLAQARALRDVQAAAAGGDGGGGGVPLWSLSLDTFAAQLPDVQLLTMLSPGGAPPPAVEPDDDDAVGGGGGGEYGGGYGGEYGGGGGERG